MHHQPSHPAAESRAGKWGTMFAQPSLRMGLCTKPSLKNSSLPAQVVSSNILVKAYSHIKMSLLFFFTSLICFSFLGYDNEEQVLLKDLQPSGGPAVRRQQILASGEGVTSSDDMECEASLDASSQPAAHGLHWQPVNPAATQRPAKSFPLPGPPSMPFSPSSLSIPPPPPPSAWPSSTSDLDSDSLYSMLMSWYMAGYHTGKWHSELLLSLDFHLPNGNFLTKFCFHPQATIKEGSSRRKGVQRARVVPLGNETRGIEGIIQYKRFEYAMRSYSRKTRGAGFRFVF